MARSAFKLLLIGHVRRHRIVGRPTGPDAYDSGRRYDWPRGKSRAPRGMVSPLRALQVRLPEAAVSTTGSCEQPSSQEAAAP